MRTYAYPLLRQLLSSRKFASFMTSRLQLITLICQDKNLEEEIWRIKILIRECWLLPDQKKIKIVFKKPQKFAQKQTPNCYRFLWHYSANQNVYDGHLFIGVVVVKETTIDYRSTIYWIIIHRKQTLSHFQNLNSNLPNLTIY